MIAFVQGATGGIGNALVKQLLAKRETELVFAGSRTASRDPGLGVDRDKSGSRLRAVDLDVTDEQSIADARDRVAEYGGIDLLINASGWLHNESMKPEKRLEDTEPAAVQHAFAVNAMSVILLAKHFVPLLRHQRRAVFSSISARVGSIEDNRLGGWYSYRAAKAAQNMFIKTLSIELARSAPNIICVALHPGTVDTPLSKPFQKHVPAGKLFSPDQAAGYLMEVIGGLSPADSGRFFAWDGAEIPW